MVTILATEKSQEWGTHLSVARKGWATRRKVEELANSGYENAPAIITAKILKR